MDQKNLLLDCAKGSMREQHIIPSDDFKNYECLLNSNVIFGILFYWIR